MPDFLERMHSGKKPVFYRYSLSGDLYEGYGWGLGNTVFAVKILYMLNQLNDSKIEEMSRIIFSFQQSDGAIYDPLVKRKSCINRFLTSANSLNSNDLFYQQTKIAETRQAFAALRCLGKIPQIRYDNHIETTSNIRKYVDNLNWKEPWGAGSHVSHLAFFLNMPYTDISADDIEKKAVVRLSI